MKDKKTKKRMIDPKKAKPAEALQEKPNEKSSSCGSSGARSGQRAGNGQIDIFQPGNRRIQLGSCTWNLYAESGSVRI